ncbi:caspase-1-like [Culicoides brevitarsis]|uniref:caspase-1-like n=1 Tax=Culicoides brevitarsis TaxID=469753 RepID=UPI00307B7B56
MSSSKNSSPSSSYESLEVPDEMDTGPNNDGRKRKLFSKQAPPLPAPRTQIDSRPKYDHHENRYYDMTNKKRGIALILNHYKFKSMKERSGTHLDEKRLKTTLKNFDFEIISETDLKYEEVKSKIFKISQMDHSNNDCFLTVIMTHGENNMLWAKDKKYPVEELYEPFFGDKCPSLIGKPKLFFIQACRGDRITEAVRKIEFDSPDAPAKAVPVTFSIPTMADLLVMYSTFEGHYSWRNPDNGSWFIQALCAELDLNGKNDDLLTLLTAVTRRVAYDFESNVPGNNKMHAKKQMPSIVSMLTKILYFTKK